MHHNTKILISDNSGVRHIKGIKFYQKTYNSQIKIANKFIGSIQNVKFKVKSKLKKLKNGDLKTALLVRTKNPITHCDGSKIKFFENAAILIGVKNKPLATRILGFLPFELRYKKKLKYILRSSLISL